MPISPYQRKPLMKELVYNKVGTFQAWIVIKMEFLQGHFSKICLLFSDTYFKEGISIAASAFYFSHGHVLCMIDFIEKELLRLNSVPGTMFKWLKRQVQLLRFYVQGQNHWRSLKCPTLTDCLNTEFKTLLQILDFKDYYFREKFATLLLHNL